MRERAQNADFRRKPQIFADSPFLLKFQHLEGAGNGRFSQETEDVAENRGPRGSVKQPKVAPQTCKNLLEVVAYSTLCLVLHFWLYVSGVGLFYLQLNLSYLWLVLVLVAYGEIGLVSFTYARNSDWSFWLMVENWFGLLYLRLPRLEIGFLVFLFCSYGSPRLEIKKDEPLKLPQKDPQLWVQKGSIHVSVLLQIQLVAVPNWCELG